MRKIVGVATVSLAALLLLSCEARGQQLLVSRAATTSAQSGNGRILSPREVMWADRENEELWTMTQVLKLTPQQHTAIRKIWEVDERMAPQPQPIQCADHACLVDWPLIGKSQRIDSLMTPQQRKAFALYVHVDNVVGERMDTLTKYLGLTSQQRWKLRPLLVKSREEMALWRGPELDDAARFKDDLYFPQPSMDCSDSLSPSTCVGNMLLIAEHDMERSVLTPPQKQVLDHAIVATREKKREAMNTVFFVPF